MSSNNSLKQSSSEKMSQQQTRATAKQKKQKGSKQPQSKTRPPTPPKSKHTKSADSFSSTIPSVIRSDSSIGDEKLEDEIDADSRAEEMELVFGKKLATEETKDSSSSSSSSGFTCYNGEFNSLSSSVSSQGSKTASKLKAQSMAKEGEEVEQSLKVDPAKPYRRRFPDEQDDPCCSSGSSSASDSDSTNSSDSVSFRSTKANRIQLSSLPEESTKKGQQGVFSSKSKIKSTVKSSDSLDNQHKQLKTVKSKLASTKSGSAFMKHS